MDRPLSPQQTKAITKTTKNSKNKKAVKVVHISNPRRVKASASEFRALVQKLTGQNAIVPETYHFTGEPQVVGDGDLDGHSMDVPKMELLVSEGVKRTDPTSEPYNDDFFTGFMPSSLLCEYPCVDCLNTSLDTF